MTPTRLVKSLEEAKAFLSSRVVADMFSTGNEFEITIRPAKKSKSRDQECYYHAQIADIAKQFRFLNQLWPPDDMKRLLVYEFWTETKDDPDLKDEWDKLAMRIVPSLSMKSTVSLGKQTRSFSVKLGSAFIEWLNAFAASNNIILNTPALADYMAWSAR